MTPKAAISRSLQAGFCALTVAAAGWAASAGAATTHHTRHHAHHTSTYRRSAACESYRRSHANHGTVTGAIAGGLLGNVVAGHGARTEGTLIGAGVGAVASHQIASNNAKHRCR